MSVISAGLGTEFMIDRRVGKGLLPVALMGLLSGCGLFGGGNGGGGGDGDPNDGPADTGLKSSITLTGTVASKEDATASASTAAVSKAASGAARLPNAKVEIQAFSPDQAGAMETVTTRTGDNGRFQFVMDRSPKDLSRVEVRVSKDGYAESVKTYTLDGESGNLSLSTQVALKDEEVTVVKTESLDAFTASGEEPTYTFALVEHPDGSTAAVSGAPVAAAQDAGAETQLQVDIPADRVDDEKVKAITAGMAQFDPTVDTEQFPGAFEGDDSTGGPDGGINIEPGSDSAGTAAAEETFRLKSTSFAQMRLEDQNGEPLELTDGASGATTAAAATPTVTMKVPANTYGTMEEDQDGDENGFQVPIYIYSQGWKFAGNGTLLASTASTWGSGKEDTDGDGYVPYTGAKDGINTENFADGQLMARVEVTEGNKWLKWINIDWPIQAGDGFNEYCFTGELSYKGSEGVGGSYNGSLKVQLPDGGYDWAYLNGGKVDYSARVAESAGADGFKLSVWNPRTDSYEDITPGSIGTDGCNDVTTALTNPRQYRVTGTVSRSSDGSTASGRMVTVSGDGFFDHTFTDSEGRYSLDVLGGRSLEVKVGTQHSSQSAYSFNVNGTPNGDEVGDNGKEARVDIALANQAPEIQGVNAPDTVLLPAGSSKEVEIGASVFDIDTPAGDVTVNVTCGAGAVSTSKGSFSYASNTCSVDSTGTYHWTVTASDGESSVEKSGTFAVEAQGSRPPRIYRVTDADGNSLECSTDGNGLRCADVVRSGTDQTYTFFAYDPDGDPVSWTGETSDGVKSLPGVSANQTISATAAAGSKQASAQVSVSVRANQAPTIRYAYADPNQVAADDDGNNGKAIDLEAKAEDPEGDGVSYSWKVGEVKKTGASASIGKGKLSEGTHQVTLTVKDDFSSVASRSQTLPLVVGEADAISAPAAADYVTKGVEAMEAQDLEKARNNFEAAYSKDADNTKANIGLALTKTVGLLNDPEIRNLWSDLQDSAEDLPTAVEALYGDHAYATGTWAVDPANGSITLSWNGSTFGNCGPSAGEQESWTYSLSNDQMVWEQASEGNRLTWSSLWVDDTSTVQGTWYFEDYEGFYRASLNTDNTLRLDGYLDGCTVTTSSVQTASTDGVPTPTEALSDALAAKDLQVSPQEIERTRTLLEEMGRTLGESLPQGDITLSDGVETLGYEVTTAATGDPTVAEVQAVIADDLLPVIDEVIGHLRTAQGSGQTFDITPAMQGAAGSKVVLDDAEFYAADALLSGMKALLAPVKAYDLDPGMTWAELEEDPLQAYGEMFTVKDGGAMKDALQALRDVRAKTEQAYTTLREGDVSATDDTAGLALPADWTSEDHNDLHKGLDVAEMVLGGQVTLDWKVASGMETTTISNGSNTIELENRQTDEPDASESFSFDVTKLFTNPLDRSNVPKLAYDLQPDGTLSGQYGEPVHDEMTVTYSDGTSGTHVVYSEIVPTGSVPDWTFNGVLPNPVEDLKNQKLLTGFRYVEPAGTIKLPSGMVNMDRYALKGADGGITQVAAAEMESSYDSTTDMYTSTLRVRVWDKGATSASTYTFSEVRNLDDLVYDSNGALWVLGSAYNSETGGEFPGVFKLDLDKEQVVQSIPMESPSNDGRYPYPNALMAGSDGQLWVGMYVWDDSTWESYNGVTSVNPSSATAIPWGESDLTSLGGRYIGDDAFFDGQKFWVWEEAYQTEGTLMESVIGTEAEFYAGGAYWAMDEDRIQRVKLAPVE